MFWIAFGRCIRIKVVSLLAASKADSAVQSLTFQRIWTSTSPVCNNQLDHWHCLTSHKTVAENDLAVKDIIIGLTILHPPGGNTKCLLENKRDTLKAYDCLNPLWTAEGRVGQLMVALLNNVSIENVSYGKSANISYHDAPPGNNLFPNSSLFDVADKDQAENIKLALYARMVSKRAEVLSFEYQAQLNNVLRVTRTSSGRYSRRGHQLKVLCYALTSHWISANVCATS